MKKKIKKQIDKADAQFFWVVAVITLLIIAIIFTPMIYRKFFASFEYGGVKFGKIKQGELIFYYGMFPINYSGKIYSYHKVFFYTDPRLNNVSINTKLSLSSKVYVSMSEDIQRCQNIQMGQITLGSFVSAFPFVKNVTGAISEKDYAKATNLPHITCKNASKDTMVIMVNDSATESIDQISDNCFAFNIGECNYLPVVERFIIGSMAQINEVTI